jgi:hypothetical protein
MLTLIGLLIGVAIGTTGVGGGVLTAPLLMLIFGMPPGTSVGTALLFSSCVKILSAGLFTARRKVHGKTLGWLLAGGIPGALAGPLLLRKLAVAGTQPWILLIVGLTVTVTAAFGLLRTRSAGAERKDRSRTLPFFSFPIGLEVGFSSAGAGALGTVVLFQRTNLEPAQVVGTDLVFGLAVSACAGGVHMAAGNWDQGVLLKLLAGGVPGALAGAFLTGRVPARPLRILVLGWAILLGLLLAGQGLHKLL